MLLVVVALLLHLSTFATVGRSIGEAYPSGATYPSGAGWSGPHGGAGHRHGARDRFVGDSCDGQSRA
jgi:hypothetical protein